MQFTVALRRFLFCSCLLGLSSNVAGASSGEPERAQFLTSSEIERQDLPFSEAVRAGSFLFLSGQLGLDATGKIVPGGIEAETHRTLLNIDALLNRNGSSLKDVIKCTVYLADIDEWANFNSVYKEFFKSPYPVRTAIGGSELAFGARVEVECLAYTPA